jgi:hypothetical protein
MLMQHSTFVNAVCHLQPDHDTHALVDCFLRQPGTLWHLQQDATRASAEKRFQTCTHCQLTGASVTAAQGPFAVRLATHYDTYAVCMSYKKGMQKGVSSVTSYSPWRR